MRGMKSLFSKVTECMWSLTPYAQCDHRCIYCCTFVQGQSAPLCDAETARRIVRETLPTLPEDSFVMLGGLSDAYPNAEREHQVTRAILEELVAAGDRFGIVTKGDTILRDLDLLVASEGRCTAQISISSTDDAALEKIDLRAPSGTRRFEVIDKIFDAGVIVELNALPWIPDVTDTGALIERVSSDVLINISPLSFGEGRDSQVILGRRYHRDEVWQRYEEEYQRFGHHRNTSWIRPSPPPQENHPMYRLPVLNDEGEKVPWGEIFRHREAMQTRLLDRTTTPDCARS